MKIIIHSVVEVELHMQLVKNQGFYSIQCCPRAVVFHFLASQQKVKWETDSAYSAPLRYIQNSKNNRKYLRIIAALVKGHYGSVAPVNFLS